jgi:hypothetical protein
VLVVTTIGCAHALSAPPQKVVFTEPEVVVAEDPVTAEFRLAKEEHDRGKLDEAARRLHDLAARPGLPVLQKASAMVQEAVCRIEGGSRAEGEILLVAALDLYDPARDEPVDPALFAQAEFWLGEAFRGAFREQKLDPETMDQQALEARWSRRRRSCSPRRGITCAASAAATASGLPRRATASARCTRSCTIRWSRRRCPGGSTRTSVRSIKMSCGAR